MVEIIPKPPKKRPLVQEMLFYLAILLLVLVIGAYFALGYFEKKEQKTIQNLNEQISAVKTEETIELKDNLLAKEKKINDFSNLLNNHWQVTPLFSFLG